jgi:phosphatidylserine/phosphatidylglycerophosphate/cardiolipin synthase-like enzyme
VEEEYTQYIETLTGLNDHVNFLHTKYMLVDPLSNSPVVISGSANFSKASTVDNDENMLVIRGNRRLADMYLGEFMRLFKHFERRNELNAMTGEERADAYYLAPDDSWTVPYYTKGNKREAERRLFR